MAKVKVAVIGTIGKTISFDADATVGATIGANLFLPDGTVVTIASLAAAIRAELAAPAAVAVVSGDDAILYYIKPITGTAIHNGTGTLTLEAHKVEGGSDILLSTGTIQLYEGSTLVTEANGYVTGSDGYTGILDSDDITGSAILELKDGAGGTVLDSITLVDIADGGNVLGFIEPENGLAWTQAPNSGSWTPAQLTTDFDCTFVQDGAAVARIARRVTLTSGDGTLAVTTTDHKDGNLNTGRVSVTVTGGGSTAVTVQFEYSFGDDNFIVAETALSSQGGDDGAAGGDGYNTATLTAYKRAASTPGDDPGTSITYTFATAAWTPGNSWSKTIPAGSSPLYALSATARSQSATDEVVSADWSAPTLILQDGDAGLNVATAYIYQRTATDSAPTLPSVTATYTFATGNIADLNNGWTDTIPSAGTDDFLWVSLATASNTATTDAIASGEWQAAEKLAEDGADGDDGIPGLPGASFLADYDNADTDGSTSSQGRYHFLTSITNNSGTFSWSTITTLGGVNYFSLYKVGTTTDYSSYFDTVAVGDVLTWWITDRKWVAFRITSIETPPTDMFKWGVSLIAFDEFDDSGNISGAGGVAVVLRFSRAVIAGSVILSVTMRAESIGTLPQRADITFRRNGIIELDGFANAKWWSTAPENTIGDSYDIRCVSIVGGPWDFEAAAVGTFVTLNSDRNWAMQRTIMEGAGVDSILGTFEITPIGVPTQALVETVANVEAADA